MVIIDTYATQIYYSIVLGYRSGSPGSIPGTTRKEKVRGPLRLVSTTEELLDRKVAAPV
jgi:hypothetical protein